MYSALDIAKTMVQLSIDNKLWLTNLKLQKILYFAWMEYFRDSGARLFEDEQFQAWKYGPVVPKVYYEYWLNVASLIATTRPPSADVDADTKQFLLDVLRRYAGMSAAELVEKSHGEGTPWKKCYVLGKKETIPFSVMERSVETVIAD